jgi:hypothetical protein
MSTVACSRKAGSIRRSARLASSIGLPGEFGLLAGDRAWLLSTATPPAPAWEAVAWPRCVHSRRQSSFVAAQMPRRSTVHAVF